MKKTVAFVITFLLTAIASLHLPTQPRLELYDVQDLTYDLPDFPSLGISLATSDPPVDPILEVHLLFTGEDLANRLGLLLPGAEVPVQFQNGLLIVRATTVQQLAVRAALVAHRARNAAVISIIYGISNAKAALSAKLFGMITK